MKKGHAMVISNAGTLTKRQTHAGHSDMVDAKALKITLPPNKHVNINARIHPSKKVIFRTTFGILSFWFSVFFPLGFGINLSIIIKTF